MSDDDPDLVSDRLVGCDQPIGCIQRGQAALGRLEKDQTWPDWCAVIVALAEGRKVCAANSGGQVTGRRYNLAMGRWLRCYGFDRIHKSDRSRLLKCSSHLEAINAWRAGLPLHEQLELNHPRVVFNRWKRSQAEDKKTLEPDQAERSDLLMVWNQATDAERTEVLASFGLEAFLRIVPASWRLLLEVRAGGQILSRAKARHPNMRLKHLKLVHDADPATLISPEIPRGSKASQ
jgi:hypothetical protein